MFDELTTILKNTPHRIALVQECTDVVNTYGYKIGFTCAVSIPVRVCTGCNTPFTRDNSKNTLCPGTPFDHKLKWQFYEIIKGFDSSPEIAIRRATDGLKSSEFTHLIR